MMNVLKLIKILTVYTVMLSSIFVISTTVLAVDTTKINVLSVTQNINDGLITVEAEIINSVDNQEVTILVCQSGKDYQTPENILYIDQIVPVIKNGYFGFQFYVSDDIEPGEYLIYMSGTNVQNKTEYQFELINDSKILYGDVNSDGKVDGMDVLHLKQYLAGWNVSIDMEKSNVNTDEGVNDIDVVILKRYCVGGWGITLG